MTALLSIKPNKAFKNDLHITVQCETFLSVASWKDFVSFKCVCCNQISCMKDNNLHSVVRYSCLCEYKHIIHPVRHWQKNTQKESVHAFAYIVDIHAWAHAYVYRAHLHACTQTNTHFPIMINCPLQMKHQVTLWSHLYLFQCTQSSCASHITCALSLLKWSSLIAMEMH